LAKRRRQRRFIEGGVGGTTLRFGELILELANAIFEVAHFAGRGL
jgi:hypothetical protein